MMPSMMIHTSSKKLRGSGLFFISFFEVKMNNFSWLVNPKFAIIKT